jgi:hypothetical protein
MRKLEMEKMNTGSLLGHCPIGELMGVWSFIIDVFPKDRKAALCSKVHCWD